MILDHNQTYYKEINMNINALIHTLQTVMPQIAESYCIVNGAVLDLNEVQNMGYDEFSERAKKNMPLKLYKYFPNHTIEIKDNSVNYSIQALKNNTIFMQSPSLFDDVYDSDISLDYNDYEKIRLLEYCRRCDLNVCESMTTQELGNILLQTIGNSFNLTGDFSAIFKQKPISELEELSNAYFLLNLKKEILKDPNWGTALSRVILSDFKEYCQHLQNIFRATCFATTPYSQLMWGGAYANFHKGFCVEYTILSQDLQYQDLFLNLFPMIYCKIRPNMTKRLAKIENKELTKEILWDIYFHGALRKSIDWAFQNEWRLLLPMKKHLTSDSYCIPFFPITKVFLGNRMSQESRKEIIEICHDRKIPYSGVVRNPNVFEMQECPTKCEDCTKHTLIF